MKPNEHQLCRALLVLAVAFFVPLSGFSSSESATPDATNEQENSLEEGADPLPSSPEQVPAEAVEGGTWLGFRGSNRDGIVHGLRVATNWSATPPVEVWRRGVGSGSSSFAVVDNRVYTQEQQGDDELVSCYDLATGETLWRHRDTTRFWDSHGGAGPRGTPTVAGGRVYSLGGTGILNALDAGDGSLLWSRNAAQDAGTEAPEHGFTSSPLVVDGIVVASVRGRLMAYDADTGEPRWSGPEHNQGYSSPQLLTIDGVPQIVQFRGGGITAVAIDGKLLWEYDVPGLPIVQPVLTADGDLLVPEVEGKPTGLRRLSVSRGSGGWSIEERWSTAGLKPDFNDMVIHDGHAYGFDGRILACIDVATGERRWKGGRYGFGQLVLLAEQDLLLVLSDKGEIALVDASPEGYRERARVPAIEGRTWNHPAIVGNIVLVRNGEEMAAFRLPAPGGRAR